jgi:hypothetical protein
MSTAGPRTATILLLTLIVLAVAGCEKAAEKKTYAYEVEVTVSGSAGSGMTLTVLDTSTGETLASDSSISLPLTVNFDGEIDYTNETPAEVTATTTGLPDGSSFSVETVYTDTVYSEPVSYTIDDGSATNTSGGPADISYRATFLLPYQP